MYKGLKITRKRTHKVNKMNNTITAEQREANFKKDLRVLLYNHGADIYALIPNDYYGDNKAVIEISMSEGLCNAGLHKGKNFEAVEFWL
jgi:hypothetical protein